MSARNRLADKVWRDLTRLVLDNKDTWRRAVVAETGLPFSRIRILRPVGPQPMTVKEIAAAATIDAPAATVAVNDLEDRGLVVRETDPNNRRSKLVSLTDAGRDLVATVKAIDDPAPAVAVRALSDAELATLRGASSSKVVRLAALPAPPSRRCARRYRTLRRRDGSLRRTTGSGHVGGDTPRRAGVSSGSSSSANGHSSAPWKMLPAVMPQRLLQVEGGLRLDAGFAVCVGHHYLLNRLGQNRIQRREYRLGQSGRITSGSLPDSRECGVCRPNTVSVCAPESRSAGDRMLGSVSEWQ